MLWEQGILNKYMEQAQQPQPCSQKQREMIARLLTEAKKHEQELLESDYSLEDRIKKELIPKLAQEQGASELITKVRGLRKELDDAENALGDLGFTCDDGDARLKYDAPERLQKAMEGALRSAKKERDRSLRKYDLAVLDVWAAESAEEARRIVEPLL